MGKPWNTERRRERVQTINNDESLTIQSEREQAELQSILLRHGAAGLVARLDETELQFMDVTAFDDYADVMRNAREAELEFMKLPSKIREIFNHDAAEWLDAAHDTDKRTAALERINQLTGKEPKNVEVDKPEGTTDPAPDPDGGAGSPGSA